MLIAVYLVSSVVYIVAFLHPTGQAIIDVNYFHEANLEMILLLITAPEIVRIFHALSKP